MNKFMRTLLCVTCNRQYRTGSILGFTCIGKEPRHEPQQMVEIAVDGMSKKGNCLRCSGYGVIIQYRAISEGKCFACNGTGKTKKDMALGQTVAK